MRPNPLDDPTTRAEILRFLRSTGSIGAAQKLTGVSETTFLRYRQKNAEFDAECENARNFWKVNQAVLFGAKVREKALKLLEKRIDDNTISDAALMRLLYGDPAQWS